MKYRFVIEDFKVIAVIENDTSTTYTLSDIVVTTIEQAKQLLPLAGINIDKIIEFENKL
jgi:hypothetical protein